MEFYRKVILQSGKIREKKLRTDDFYILEEDTILVKNLPIKYLISG